MNAIPLPPPPSEPLAPLAHRPPKAAERLGMSKSRLYELIEAKEIRAYKVGHSTFIPESELVRFVNARMRACGHEPA